jgi:hypothetical protein
MYPVGCLVIIGPILAMIHQASSPVDYDCNSCQLQFASRSTAAKGVVIGFLLFVVYLIWTLYRDAAVGALLPS